MPIRRPGTVTASAIMCIIYGTLATLGGLCALGGQAANFGGNNLVAEELEKQLDAAIPAYKSVQIAGNVVSMLVGVLLLVSGIALLNLASWARTLAIAACVLAILTNSFHLVYQAIFVMPAMSKAVAAAIANQADIPPEAAEMMSLFMTIGMVLGLAFVVAIILYLTVILFLLFTQSAKSAFSGHAPADVEDRLRRYDDDDRGREEDWDLERRRDRGYDDFYDGKDDRFR